MPKSLIGDQHWLAFVLYFCDILILGCKCYRDLVYRPSLGDFISNLTLSHVWTFVSVLPQLHNEDDTSEGAVGSEPSTSSQATVAVLGISNPAVDTEAPPPPYASVALGATAAPGTDTWSFPD